jgi:hypothetical protein
MRKNSQQTNWYTPPHIIEFAWNVLRGIDLDPASTPEANQVVGANRIFTETDDGLAQSWDAKTVFCNPPYGLGNVTAKWYWKMFSEHHAGNFTHGLFLANATTETRWMQHALGNFPVLLVARRLRFWLPGGSPDDADQSGFLGSALVYMPPLRVWPAPLPGAPGDAPLQAPLNAPLAAPLRRFLDAGADLGRVSLPTAYGVAALLTP